MAIRVDAGTFRAGSVSLRPVDYFSSTYGNFGHYSIVTTSGATVGLTATDPILAFRWTSIVANVVLLRIGVSAGITASTSAGIPYLLEAVIARAYTASDTAGTAVTMSALQKMRTNMGNSAVADIRISTTAKLTAGTRTLDTLGFGAQNLPFLPVATTVGSASIPVDLYKWDPSGKHPVVLAANEGFIVRAPVALNTAGSVAYTFTVDWAEVPFATDIVGF